MENGVLDGLTGVFGEIVTDIVDFVVGFLPTVVPLIILGIGVPLALRFIRRAAPK
ncbi:MAG: hypothetical protein QXT77_09035 [Candidatus Methanomethylicaceae archaeon]